MQSAETVLDVIRKRGARGLPIERLYRQLFNPQLYLMAYRRIAANKGAMTPGVTGETVDGMSLDKIDACIGSLRHERYRWSPAKRVYIPKKNGKKRPLGADLVGQAGRRGGAPLAGGVLRHPVLRSLSRFPYRSWLSHRPERGGQRLVWDALVH